MEQSKQNNGLINLLALLAVAVAGFAAARYANSAAGQVGSLFLGLGMLVAAVSWFQMRLEDNERLEKLEFDELAKTHSGSAMFAGKGAEVFPAQRSREQFERFFVPVFTVLLCLAQAGGAWLFWRWLSKSTTQFELKQPTVGLALFGLFALVLFLLGKFSTTIARLENNRLLRPGASYLLLNAYLCAVVVLGIAGVEAGWAKTDFYIAHALCVLLALIALEAVINLVLEIYRPRVKGKIERPLYESRLVGLLGQPEGLITTAAEALDYQFGFSVSETWFYRLFFERALKWLLLAQVLVLVLSTCVVFIEPGEQGLLERFGKPVEGHTLLEPGPHCKLPWPIDRVYRFRTERIQSFELGAVLGPEGEKQQEKEGVVLWTVAHTKEQEDNFLVANREPPSLEGTNDVAAKRTPPVSLLTGTMPVQFQITDLEAWAYNNEGAPALLQDLARREVVRYFVSADMNEIMSDGRLAASETLRQRIQDAADQRGLGARILSIGLQDMHPPVKVAEDYEKVVAALQTKEAKILAARADDIRTNALAGAQATTTLNQAAAEKTGRVIGAFAQAALFTNQIPAFEAAPSVYAQRAYLKTFVGAIANSPKYLVLTTNYQDVYTFDLQNSLAGELLGLKAPAPKK
jgi:regulator of protease activity HflC (stomatin/prohibitin superfamily)